MTRVALGVEYDGTDFAGWQSQANARSVQHELQQAASGVAAHPVTVHAAGRTDAGVHAAGQVVHFDTHARRAPDQWLLGINSALPGDVSVRWAVPVDAEFDARRSALWRRYAYVVQCGAARSALARRYAWWVHARLDVSAMHAASRAWLGEQDFSAFRAAGCQSHSPMRCMSTIRLRERAPFVVFEFTANAFVYHMVRNLVGTLVQIGLGRRPVQWARELLAGRDRSAAAATAPACGLTLAQVRYDDDCGIPGPGAVLWLDDDGGNA